MKKIENIKKPNFLKRLFVKLCRIIGYEIIDQSNLYLPTLNKQANESLSSLGEKNISIPLGETKITRIVKSLDIIIKTCTSVNLVTQNKKRIFEKDKSEYTFRSINSIINSLKFSENNLKKTNIEFEILNLDLEKFNNIKTLNKDNPIIEKNMKSTMASIRASFDLAKGKSSDLVYFVEDDYIHKKESIFEMISTYEKISSEQNKELFICPVDYPYLYKKFDNSQIFIGNKHHWRTVNESLLTFLTSKSLIEKYWNELVLMCENENVPFETPLHSIYEREVCISPIPSLAMHCTNINSVFGLSPNIDWVKLWDENES